MRRVEFVVPGRPSRWQRTTEYEGERKNTAQHNRDLANLTQYAFVAMRMARLKPFEGPVRLTVLAVFPRNKRRPKWMTKEAWATGQRLYMRPDPDLDNICKLIADSIQPKPARRGQPRPRSFCIADDNEVCSLVADKVMAADGEKPRTIVTIEALPACYSDKEADACKAPAQ